MSRKRVPHAVRDNDCGLHHVSMHLIDGLPNLRDGRTWTVLCEAIRAARERFDCRIVGFSVMSNHLHFVIETLGRDRGLSRAVQGLKIRIAKALNKLWGRKGRVYDDRFFSRLLRSLKEIERALRYVLQNARRHGIPLPKGHVVDPFSSARWYPHWIELEPDVGPRAPTVQPVQYFLLPPLSISHAPGPRH